MGWFGPSSGDCSCCGGCTACTDGNLFDRFTTISGSISGAPGSPIIEASQTTGSCSAFRSWGGACVDDLTANVAYPTYQPIPMIGSTYYLNRQRKSTGINCANVSGTGNTGISERIGMSATFTQECVDNVIVYSFNVVLTYEVQNGGGGIAWADRVVPPDSSGRWTGGDPDGLGIRHFWNDRAYVGSGNMETWLYMNGVQGSNSTDYFIGSKYAVSAMFVKSGFTDVNDIPLSYSLSPLYNVLGITGSVTLS